MIPLKVENEEMKIKNEENEYGNCIKFPDGTMICCALKQGINVEYNEQRGSCYIGSIDKNITFPASFVEPPIVNISAVVDIENVTYFATLVDVGKVYTNYISGTKFMRPNIDAGKNLRTDFYYIAIGKWK